MKEKHRKTQLCHECRDNDKWIMDRISTNLTAPLGHYRGNVYSSPEKREGIQGSIPEPEKIQPKRDEGLCPGCFLLRMKF